MSRNDIRRKGKSTERRERGRDRACEGINDGHHRTPNSAEYASRPREKSSCESRAEFGEPWINQGRRHIAAMGVAFWCFSALSADRGAPALTPAVQHSTRDIPRTFPLFLSICSRVHVSRCFSLSLSLSLSYLLFPLPLFPHVFSLSLSLLNYDGCQGAALVTPRRSAGDRPS